MSDFKESKDNPLHREYGVLRNTKYIIQKMAQYQPSVLFLMVLAFVCQSVFSYFWGIFGKYVIDIIETEEGAAAEARLIKVIVIAGSIAALITLGNTIANSKWWYRVIFVRMNMITERIAKVLAL